MKKGGKSSTRKREEKKVVYEGDKVLDIISQEERKLSSR